MCVRHHSHARAAHHLASTATMFEMPCAAKPSEPPCPFFLLGFHPTRVSLFFWGHLQTCGIYFNHGLPSWEGDAYRMTRRFFLYFFWCVPKPALDAVLSLQPKPLRLKPLLPMPFCCCRRARPSAVFFPKMIVLFGRRSNQKTVAVFSLSEEGPLLVLPISAASSPALLTRRGDFIFIKKFFEQALGGRGSLPS